MQPYDPTSIIRERDRDPVDAAGTPEIVSLHEEPKAPTLDSSTGAIEEDVGDGNILIHLDGVIAAELPDASTLPFDANLADYIDPTALGVIAEEVLQGINSDIQSRSDWIQTRAKGIDLLALKVEEPKSPAAGTGTGAEGQAVVRSNVLLEAVLRFQANADAELLPSAGPVKVRNDAIPLTAKAKMQQMIAMGVLPPGGMPPGGAPPAAPPPMPPGAGMGGMPPGPQPPLEPPDASAPAIPPGLPPGPPPMGHNGGPPLPDDTDIQAEALELTLNHYLTKTCTEYYPDTRRMLFYTGFGGASFKKVYHCPLRRRPVSDTVDAEDLIVDDAQVDLRSCGRVTHKIEMRQSTMKRMQLLKAYRDIDLTPPSPPDDNPVEQRREQVAGFSTTGTIPADYKFTIYECRTDLNVPGFEHMDTETGEPSGLALPYRVTIDRDTRQVLDIRRNWKEGDPLFLPKMPFVKFGFVEGISYYGIGLLHMLGNATAAVTATWRMALDTGMFASFPGFLYTDDVSRQMTNNFAVGPGQGKKITASGDIRASIMPLPYKDVSPGLMAIMQHIEQSAQRIGGVGDLQVGEGRQDAPVGTTLAMLDQATKVMGAVHKGLHHSQGEEFSLLRELLIENPEPLIASRARNGKVWERDEIIAALNNHDLSPASDPNTPSHMHRVMQATAMIQLAGMMPQLYDLKAVHRKALIMYGNSDPDSLFAPPMPPQEPPMDPLFIAKMKDIEAKMAIAKMKSDQAELDRIAKVKLELMKQETARIEQEGQRQIELMRLRIEQMETAGDIATHVLAVPQVEQFLSQHYLPPQVN